MRSTRIEVFLPDSNTPIQDRLCQAPIFAAGFGQGRFAPRRIDMWSLKGFGFSVEKSNYAVMHQVSTLEL